MSYIYKVLKQVHPETGVSKKAMGILNSFVNDTFVRGACDGRRPRDCGRGLTALPPSTARPPASPACAGPPRQRGHPPGALQHEVDADVARDPDGRAPAARASARRARSRLGRPRPVRAPASRPARSRETAPSPAARRARQARRLGGHQGRHEVHVRVGVNSRSRSRRARPPPREQVKKTKIGIQSISYYLRGTSGGRRPSGTTLARSAAPEAAREPPPAAACATSKSTARCA